MTLLKVNLLIIEIFLLKAFKIALSNFLGWINMMRVEGAQIIMHGKLEK